MILSLDQLKKLHKDIDKHDESYRGDKRETIKDRLKESREMEEK